MAQGDSKESPDASIHNADLPKFASLGDLRAVLTLGICAPFSWFLPKSVLKSMCQIFARLHIALRGSRSSQLVGHPAMERLGYDATELERKFTATVYEEICYTLREYRGSGWSPQITLGGKEYIDQALEAGRGAVLWISPCSHAELVVKKALYEANIPLVNLRSYIHPYSGTRFGKRFLNPVRTSVEDRYLHATVVLHPNREAVALRELQMWLRKNAVVSVFAIAASERPFETPCLSGTLKLAMGAPTLALLSRAPLLPVYAFPTSSESFQVIVESPLRGATKGVSGSVEEHMGKAFAGLTDSWVTKCPHVWRGWFSRVLWTPD